MNNEHRGTFEIIALIVMASALALLVWNLMIRDVGAAPLDGPRRPCYDYTVMVHDPVCNVFGWCFDYVTAHVNGTSTVTRKASGWHLVDRQWVTVQVCR